MKSGINQEQSTIDEATETDLMFKREQKAHNPRTSMQLLCNYSEKMGNIAFISNTRIHPFKRWL